MRWFVKRLIDIRKDLERTPRYTSDIIFDPREILDERAIFGIRTMLLAKTKAVEMLYSIQNDRVFLSGINIHGDYLKHSVQGNGRIKIIGYQTEILDKYLNSTRLKNNQSNANTFEDLKENQVIEMAQKNASVTTTREYGYLKYYQQGQRITIGKITTRAYRLVATLFEPQPGILKTVEGVFNAIRLPRDDKDLKLKDEASKANRQRTIIDNTMKELQKIEGLTGHISLKYSNSKNVVAIKLD
jgi:hypothetical protein